MLNYLATSVKPASVAGRFPASPFANLDYAQKAEAFRMLEQDNAEIVGLLDSDTPEPTKETLSGLMKYLAGALRMFPAFGAYSEFGVFDRESLTATQRPVGWENRNSTLSERLPRTAGTSLSATTRDVAPPRAAPAEDRPCAT